MIIPSSVFVCSLFAMVSGFIANSMLHVNDVCLVLRSILHLSILKKQDIFGRVVLKNTITSEQKYINICHNMNQPKKHQRMTSVQQKSFQIHQQKVCLQVVIFFHPYIFAGAPWHSCGQLWLLLCLHWKRLRLWRRLRPWQWLLHRRSWTCTKLGGKEDKPLFSIWMFPKIVGFPPQIIHFNRVFHIFSL